MEEKIQKKKSFLTKYDILTIMISIILVVGIRIFIFDTAVVSGASMEHTIHDDDRVAYYKLTEPQKGKIAIVDTGENVIIKRVIATEGDTVEIRRGLIYVNDELLYEPYIKEEQMEMDFEKVLLGEGEFYALGDNRNNSSDSRVYGAFSVKENFKGNVLFKFKFFKLFKVL